jgi:hypothetical protein
VERARPVRPHPEDMFDRLVHTNASEIGYWD